MSARGTSDSHLNSIRPILAERRPKMLKDFLIEEANSPSLSSLVSHPRLPRDLSMRFLAKTNLHSAAPSPNKAIVLLRSRSKVASATISALEAMVKVVRAIPRTLSKQQGSRGITNLNKTPDTAAEDAAGKVAVRIKDIIRWRSFRDMAEEEMKIAPPSPVNCATATTVSTLSTSSGSSWCESDFSSDYSPRWTAGARFAWDSYSDCATPLEPVKTDEKFFGFPRVGDDSIEENPFQKMAGSFSPVGIESKRQALWEESKGQSPVSAIDFAIGEDGEWRWSFEESPANKEIARERGEYEEEEKEIMELLNQVKSSISKDCISCKISEEKLLVDFFRSALTEGPRSLEDDELVWRAERWVRGECDNQIESNNEWGFEGKKEAYLRDMKWSKFDEDDQQAEMIVEIESGVWNLLLDDLLDDILRY